jgi:hypothetical protein
MYSIAQPSPPGRSSGFNPGNSSHINGAFSLPETYRILGRMNGGSITDSLSSEVEMSTILDGSFMICTLS